MSATRITTCPGCGLERPSSDRPYDRKFHASAECWALFEQVITAEFQDAVLFGQVHQLTVDAYAVQHAGGRHPDKSVCVHSAGLCRVLERGFPPMNVAAQLQRLVRRASWPHFEPPAARAKLTVGDVALADSPPAHAALVREWAGQVWQAWSAHHDVVRQIVDELLRRREGRTA
jgi:hypothetical protein